MYRVVLGHVDVADGIVDLVQEVLVIVRTRHTFQTTDLTLEVRGWHHLGLGNAGVELQLVGRIESDDMLVGIVGIFTITQLGVYLSHQKPFAGFLLAAFFVLDDLSQIGDGFLKALAVDVKVGIGVVPVLDGTVVHAVAALLGDDVFGFIQPVHFRIALCLPGPCPSVDGWLCHVETGNIAEGG